MSYGAIAGASAAAAARRRRMLLEKEEEEMTQASISMRKIEEILHLKFEIGLTHREIAKSCGVSTSTVSEYSTHAKAAGLSWPLPEGMKKLHKL